MALLKPLVFDGARGVNRQLDPGDGLHVTGDLQLDGKAGFFGAAPQSKPALAGSWGQSLDELIKALALLGLVTDSRPAGWLNGVNAASLLGNVGPYEPGRLIIGSTGGWMPLDQPALVPGVIQVPTSHAGLPETSPVSGLPMQTLAYSPVLSYGATPPPLTALAGALWFDTSSSELKVYTGSSWQPVHSAALRALLNGLLSAAKGAILAGDGSGGVTPIAPPVGPPGRVLAYDSGQQGHFINLVSVAMQSPWPNGASSTDPLPAGGGRPAGMTQAIWCNPIAGGETLGFWDETSLQWKKTYVNNPVLNKLAELRSSIANGDLFTVTGNVVDRLPIGNQGDALVVDSGVLKWHDRFSTGAVAPAGALDGDLWLDSITSVVRIRENGNWLDFNEVNRYVDVNASGQALKAGQPLVHGASSWQLAGPSTPAGSFIAIALDDVVTGGRVAAGVGGVISLSEAQWSAVIDGAEPVALGSGLSAGRDYYVSSSQQGMLTTKPVNPNGSGTGVAVGTALSSTHLLLRNSPLRFADVPTRAHIGATPPPAKVGELWWSTVTGELYIYFDDGGSKQWVSASADGTSNPGGAGGGAAGGPVVAVTALEAIDWAADPLAAAIRIHHSDGTDTTLRLRGAGGTVVTMADNQTLVIDAGGSRTPPSNAAGGGTAGGGTAGGGSGAGPVIPPAANALLPGNGVSADPITHFITTIDEGWL